MPRDARSSAGSLGIPDNGRVHVSNRLDGFVHTAKNGRELSLGTGHRQAEATRLVRGWAHDKQRGADSACSRMSSRLTSRRTPSMVRIESRAPNLCTMLPPKSCSRTILRGLQRAIASKSLAALPELVWWHGYSASRIAGIAFGLRFSNSSGTIMSASAAARN